MYQKKETTQDDMYNLFMNFGNFMEYERRYIKENLSNKTIAPLIKWSDEIRSVCDSEEEAMELFYKIFEQFATDYHSGLFPNEAFTTPIDERKDKRLGRYFLED